MKFKLGKICRGGGVVYLAAHVTAVSPQCMVRFSAYSERGINLPIESYASLKLQAGASDNDIVLATPMLSTKSLIIQADEVSSDGSVISTKRRKLSRFIIKWASRLNYKLNYREVARIRDTDRVTYSDQIHIKDMYNIVIPTKGSFLVKGIICSPISSTNLELILLGADGSACSSFRPYLLPAKRVLNDGVPRLEMPFTARIPDDGSPYCLVAQSSFARSGFMSFYRGSNTPLFRGHIPMYYRIGDTPRWNEVVLDRARQYEFANPDDYQVEQGPLFSVIVPLYHTPVAFLHDMIQSVLDQLYRRWELILVNSTPEDADLSRALASYADARIRVVTLADNLGISENTNAGIQVARGDYIAFFDHDDVLDKLALFQYASAIADDPTIDALYCDEDFLTEDGGYVNPHFKSDLNIDLLRVHNYITHFLTVRASLARELMLRKEYDGAQDYDFVLRLVERTDCIKHIPEVLYHWRMSAASTAKDADSKPYAEIAGKRALEEHLGRMGLSASVSKSEFSNFFRVRYDVTGHPLVSIIIPNKDSISVLSRCVDSIISKTTYDAYEIIIVENNSVEPETFEYYNRVVRQYEKVSVVTWPAEFNYSKINNFGVEHAQGEYLLLLNNDTEVIEPQWLESMLGFCQRDDVGAVGAKLLYPDDTIQHAGVAMIHCHNLGEMGGPLHVFCHLDRSDPGYMNRAAFSQDVSIVTGACLMTRRSVYEELGGLSERYAVAYNDVDYCLRVRAHGYLVVYDADALLYHYESFSRGSDEVGERARRFVTEQGKLRSDWPDCFLLPDPYHGKYLSLC